MWYIPGVTWAQTITIVVPIVVAIVVGLFYSGKQVELLGNLMNARLTAIEARFTNVDSRFDSMDSRFDSMDSRFNIMETRFNGFEAKVETRLNAFEARVENRLERIENRFAEIHQDLRDLRGLLQDALRPRTTQPGIP